MNCDSGAQIEPRTLHGAAMTFPAVQLEYGKNVFVNETGSWRARGTSAHPETPLEHIFQIHLHEASAGLCRNQAKGSTCRIAVGNSQSRVIKEIIGFPSELESLCLGD
jgi:hypothetical protein